MKKLTYVSILIYMFCFLHGCTSIDEASWKQHLTERERLLDRAPTFLEVYEANRKDKSKITKDRGGVWKADRGVWMVDNK